jgi:hypothetical protein
MFDRLAFVPSLGPVGGLAWAATGGGVFAWLHASAMVPFHYGGICGHGLAEPHCAGCYVAAAMVVTGLIAAFSSGDRPSLARLADAALSRCNLAAG